MYIPPSTLLLLVGSYLLFLLSVDWISQPEGAWYRPFVIGMVVILAAAWSYREKHTDDL